MSAIKSDLLNFARKLTNYDIDATAGGLWTDTTHYRATVPAGKRWILIGGDVYRAVSSTWSMDHYDAAGNLVLALGAGVAGTGHTFYPTAGALTVQPSYPITLDAGEYCECIFGVAQNANSYCSCIVLEVDI